MYSAVIVTGRPSCPGRLPWIFAPTSFRKADPLLPLRPGAQNFPAANCRIPEDGFEHRISTAVVLVDRATCGDKFANPHFLIGVEDIARRHVLLAMDEARSEHYSAMGQPCGI